MSIIPILLILSTSLPIFSAPTSNGESHSSRGHGLSRDMIKLLNEFAPVIYLSSQEEFFPSSVEYMLPHYELLDGHQEHHKEFPKPPLNSSSLSHLPLSGRFTYLSISEPRNAQPDLSDKDSMYLHGPNWEDLRGKKATRPLVKEDVYGFHVLKDDGVVDLFYWTFYPYNLGKEVGPFGFRGNHVGDWEHLRIRTVNGTGHSVDYVVHQESLALGEGTMRWEDVPKFDGRPIAYSAAGSHGLWATPGSHVYANALNIFKLIDETDDLGAIWDTKNQVVPIQYWNDPEVRRRKKIHSSGSGLGWLNFAGKWGNKGEDDCSWKNLPLPCQVGTGPPGPNRDFRGAPGCIISPLYPGTIGYSTLSFSLDESAVTFGHMAGITKVAAELLCTGNVNHKSEGENEQQAAFKAEQPSTMTMKAFNDFKGLEDRSYLITTSGCSRFRSTITSYRISLCLDESNCISQSSKRKICTYQSGTAGYTAGKTAAVHDTDPWMWRY